MCVSVHVCEKEMSFGKLLSALSLPLPASLPPSPPSLTVRVLAIPAKSSHCLLKQLLSIGLEAGVIVSVGEKTADGGQVSSLGDKERRGHTQI